MSAFEHFSRPSENGWTVLSLHGTGGDERQMLPIVERVAPKWGVLSPRGKSTDEPGLRWFRRFAEGKFDLPDLKEKVGELADWVESLEIPNLVAVGYSNGASVAAALMFLRPRLLRGAAMLRPSVPFIPEERLCLGEAHAWLGGGRFDDIVDPHQTEQLGSMLLEYGASVEVAWAETGHGLDESDMTSLSAWMARLSAG
ncbi:MAG: hypothetical protein KIT11_05080 [Fimbriimonadaceae bacterium]|nr:hypothetical protein [Fimbriimonadaceae bacterium]QYK56733.1 MAG: hypothetical protein KF733_04440 [Fimbriimonadaceae bacterium]